VIGVAAGPDWASATTAIGTVAVAVVAVGVALFAERRAGFRLREEQKRSDDRLAQERALHAKEIADERVRADKMLAEQFAHSDAQLAGERVHAAEQLQADRIWNRRVDLYARINAAFRSYLGDPPTGSDGQDLSPGDVGELVDLVTEADMVASEPVRDLVTRFTYDADSDGQIEIWNDFIGIVRSELKVNLLDEV